MIYDRPYMRSDWDRREASVLSWIIGITIAVYAVQHLFGAFLGRGNPLSDAVNNPFTQMFALSWPAMKAGYFWTPITYAFLHSNNPLHIIGNLLAIFFIGRELVPVLGPRRLLGVYFGSVLLGALCWLGTLFLTAAYRGAGPSPAPLVGASGAAFGLLVVFACFYPNRPISFLLFFIIPVTVKPKHLAIGIFGITVFCLLFFEIPGAGSTMAHSSHFGGMAAGFLYFRLVHLRLNETGHFRRPGIELPAWLRKRKPGAVTSSYKVNVSRPQDIRAEVDRILDKINSQGFGSLTDQERHMLDEARELLNKR